MPASRTVSSSLRSSRGAGAMPTRSAGVQTAPRANTGTSLTCRSRPSRRMSGAQVERRGSRPDAALGPSRRRRWSACAAPASRGCAATSASTPGIAHRGRPASVAVRGTAARARRRSTASTAGSPAGSGRREAHRGHAGRRRRRPSSGRADRADRAGGRGPARRAATARPPPGPGRNPGSGRTSSCETSAGCRAQRPGSASARPGAGAGAARARAPGRRSPARSRRAEAVARRRARDARHIDADSRISSPLR